MQISTPVNRYSRNLVVLLLLLAGACQTPEPLPDNQYQRALAEPASSATTTSRPVRQLQNQALAAINEDQFALASGYLQRAIKIEPRNGWSWHYLADIYWRQGDIQKCRAMLDRAQAYAAGDGKLIDANRELRGRCA